MMGLWLWLAASLPIFAMAGGYPCCCSPLAPLSSRRGSRASCFCCGPGYYDYQAPAGGPIEWKLTIGSITGSCFGAACSPAGGTWYATYFAGCTWITPLFTLCTIADCYAWVFSIGYYPACDANPVDYDQMRVSLASVCSGAQLIRYENPCATRVKESDGTPCAGLNCRCDPPVTLTCDGSNTLEQTTSLGVCVGPSTVTAESSYA